MIADEDPNAPHTVESCWLKTEASDKTNKKTGRGESTRKQRHVGNPKFRPEALTDGHTFLFADYFNLTVFKQSAVLKQQGGYGTSDR